ncbi:hypothetical protein [Streptomyces sp. KR55]|uniref:hypothetical protein n=1 Tax=Streptomyces sp. KR55 TaxID=3457425 RepID=UPI003FD0FD94
MTAVSTEPNPTTTTTTATDGDDEARAVAHAEAVWRTLSEAVDRVPATDRVPFLIRLALLTALDDDNPERFAALVAEAEATA